MIRHRWGKPSSGGKNATSKSASEGTRRLAYCSFAGALALQAAITRIRASRNERQRLLYGASTAVGNWEICITESGISYFARRGRVPKQKRIHAALEQLESGNNVHDCYSE